MTPLLRVAFWFVVALGSMVYRQGRREKIGGIEVLVRRDSKILGALSALEGVQRLMILYAISFMLPQSLFGLAKFLIGR